MRCEQTQLNHRTGSNYHWTGFRGRPGTLRPCPLLDRLVRTMANDPIHTTNVHSYAPTHLALNVPGQQHSDPWVGFWTLPTIDLDRTDSTADRQHVRLRAIGSLTSNLTPGTVATTPNASCVRAVITLNVPRSHQVPPMHSFSYRGHQGQKSRTQRTFVRTAVFTVRL